MKPAFGEKSFQKHRPNSHLAWTGLFDLAYRAYCRIAGVVIRGEASWASLAAAEREEMEEVVAMLTEAA